MSASAIPAASHVYHEKRVAWVSISMHACEPVPKVMGLCLAALQAAGARLLKLTIKLISTQSAMLHIILLRVTILCHVAIPEIFVCNFVLV